MMHYVRHNHLIDALHGNFLRRGVSQRLTYSTNQIIFMQYYKENIVIFNKY